MLIFLAAILLRQNIASVVQQQLVANQALEQHDQRLDEKKAKYELYLQIIDFVNIKLSKSYMCKWLILLNIKLTKSIVRVICTNDWFCRILSQQNQSYELYVQMIDFVEY